MAKKTEKYVCYCFKCRKMFKYTFGDILLLTLQDNEFGPAPPEPDKWINCKYCGELNLVQFKEQITYKDVMEINNKIGKYVVQKYYFVCRCERCNLVFKYNVDPVSGALIAPICPRCYKMNSHNKSSICVDNEYECCNKCDCCD